jgi:cytochrome d ubiquinol oxidase subunit I
VSELAVLASAAPTGINQDYLLQARQMQALSFAVHIPLVCFGIAFPTLVLFIEWLYLRTGDELYRTLAKRWTKVMAALFAAGVVTGTILSFEMGLLWPSFTASFGSVFGLGFAIEGFSFFMEAIFIGIYIYGWNRLSPRAHFASGIPVAIAGVTGSLTVISVNGWMNIRPASIYGMAKPWTCIRWRRSLGTATSGTSSCTCIWPGTSSPAS